MNAFSVEGNYVNLDVDPLVQAHINKVELLYSISQNTKETDEDSEIGVKV